MLEELIKNWKVFGFEQITHESFHNLVGNRVLLKVYTLGDQLNQELKPCPLTKNVFEQSLGRLIESLRPLIDLLGCSFHSLVSLLEQLLNQHVVYLVVDHHLDGLVKVHHVLHMEQEVNDVLGLHTSLLLS